MPKAEIKSLAELLEEQHVKFLELKERATLFGLGGWNALNPFLLMAIVNFWLAVHHMYGYEKSKAKEEADAKRESN